MTFEQWHAQRVESLREPHGWLSLTGLHWLDETPRTFDGVPGSWFVRDDEVHVTNGLGPDQVSVPEAGSVMFAQFGDARVEVIRRTGRNGIRIRDPHSPTRVGFTGAPRFAISDKWVVPATFEPYPEPCVVMVGAAQEGLENRLTGVGEFRFTMDGAEHTLVATGSVLAPTVLFHDKTNGDTTAGWRSLTVLDPKVLDFNRAVNMPSAFTPYGTCPLPPAPNALPFAIHAGERLPVATT